MGQSTVTYYKTIFCNIMWPEDNIGYSPRQMTPASCLCWQLCEPSGSVWHSFKYRSDPLQRTLSKNMRPVPSPKSANFTAFAPGHQTQEKNSWSVE